MKNARLSNLFRGQCVGDHAVAGNAIVVAAARSDDDYILLAVFAHVGSWRSIAAGFHLDIPDDLAGLRIEGAEVAVIRSGMMKTSPPAAGMEPPMFMVPVLWMPFALRASSYVDAERDALCVIARVFDVDGDHFSQGGIPAGHVIRRVPEGPVPACSGSSGGVLRDVLPQSARFRCVEEDVAERWIVRSTQRQLCSAERAGKYDRVLQAGRSEGTLVDQALAGSSRRRIFPARA